MNLNIEMTQEFHHRVKRDPSGFIGAIGEVNKIILDDELEFSGKKLPFSMQPLLVTSKESDYFKEVTELISNSLEKLLDAYVKDMSIREFFSHYKDYEELILIDPGYKKKVRISRYDTIWNGEDDFKILECNTCCPGGVVVLGSLKNKYIETPYMQKVLDKYENKSFLCDTPEGFLFELESAYREYGGLKKYPTIAFAKYNGKYNYELTHMKRFAEQAGFEAVICDLTELKLEDDKLFYQDISIDIIYNKVDQLELGKDDMKDVINAIKLKKVCSVNSYLSMFIGESKMCLALLTNKIFQKKYLSNKEIQAINKHIPWTRKLEDTETDYKSININTLEFAKLNKDSLVLKVDNETRGSNVYLGHACTQEEWNKLIFDHKNSNWIIQEYSKVPQIRVPVNQRGYVEFTDKKFGIDMFMFGGRYAGVVSRISDKNIINVGQGGFEQPVLEISNVNERLLI